MREITTHHDGFGLTESLRIEADEPGPGGASHLYRVFAKGPEQHTSDMPEAGEYLVAEIHFQKGPRNVEDSQVGIVESVLLAIIADRMNSFNAGEYRCRENSLVATHVEEAMNWLWRRAMSRSQRGVLGTTSK